MNALKQQEQAFESVMRSNEQEQQESVAAFKSDIATALDNLHAIPATFSAIYGQIDSIYRLAYDLSWRIRDVDTAISRCSETAARVRHYADLTECLGSIDDLIAAKDFAKSADFVRRLLEVSAELLSPENSEHIEAARKSVLQLLHERLESGDADPAEIFGCFASCHAQDEGIKCLADLHYKFIIEATRHDVVSLHQLPRPAPTDDAIAPHVETYVKFLDTIAQRIVQAAGSLGDPARYAVFVRLLLERCDGMIESIIQEFREHRTVDHFEKECLRNAEINLAMIDRVTEEISSFAKQWSLFEKFLRGKLRPGIGDPFFIGYREKFKFATAASTGLTPQSEANRALQLALVSYANLTQSFLGRVSSNLISLIRPMAQSEAVSNAIVDLFFVYHRILRRSIDTHSVTTTCTVFNVITGIIRDDLMPAVRIHTRPNDILGKTGVLINACALGDVYVQKLVALSEGAISKQFSDDGLAAIQSGLSDLKSCGSEFETIRRRHEKSMTTELTSPCLNLKNGFSRVPWNGEISAQTETELHEGFKAEFGAVFGSYKKVLSSTNWANIIKKMAAAFAPELERIVKTKKFNATGALLLKRAVVWLAGLFENQAEFKKLVDMAAVMTLPAPENVDDIWGKRATGPDTVTLSIDEMREVLKLREDWATKDFSFLADLMD
jgi:hypothetical protein